MNAQKLLTRLATVIAVAAILAGTAAHARQTSKQQAITTVRSILTKNAKRDRIDKITGIEAVKVKPGWHVTAHIILSASGKPRRESPEWIVRYSDGIAVPSSQLSAELSRH